MRAIAKETLSNSQTLLAFLALVNCDVIVARNILPEHDAGLYAGGLILTKAMLFLPQFVVVVAFPSMSTAGETPQRAAPRPDAGRGSRRGRRPRLRRAAPPRPHLRRRHEYAEIDDRLWLFAVLGTVLSLLQLLIYAVLARQGTRSVYLVWAALAVLLVIASQASTLEGCC